MFFQTQSQTYLTKRKMKLYLLILTISILVAYSQLIMKWRSNISDQMLPLSFLQALARLLSDPAVLSAYFAALIASFGWLYVVTKLPLTVAFPVYIGVTFAMVSFGGVFFLSESLTTQKLVAVVLIISGIMIGVSADA